MSTIKSILVTGSSGTIGTALCEILLKDGYEVIGVDKRKNKWSEVVNNLTIVSDLRDFEQTNSLPTVDLVVHLAANARVYQLVKNPILAKENLNILFNVLEYCRRHRIKRFIFASSREVYGNLDSLSKKEEAVHIFLCESPYAASKLGGEAFIYAYHKCYDINFVILRFSNVYGKYDESDRVVPFFIRLTKASKDLIIYGREKMLDFTYIDDAVEGITKCIRKFDSVANNVFNIATGKGTLLTEVAHLIQKYMNRYNNKILIKENRTGEILKFVADISKAKKLLNYTPKTDIADGIKKSIQWYTQISFV